MGDLKIVRDLKQRVCVWGGVDGETFRVGWGSKPWGGGSFFKSACGYKYKRKQFLLVW